MEETALSHILSNVGVPAAICFYTLFRVNQTLQNLTDAINKLTNEMDKRIDKVESQIRDLATETKMAHWRE